MIELRNSVTLTKSNENITLSPLEMVSDDMRMYKESGLEFPNPKESVINGKIS